jgi:NitT/TauT family transport system substrate-binding protein
MIQGILHAATGAVLPTDVHAIGKRHGERRVRAVAQSIGGHRLLLVVVHRAGRTRPQLRADQVKIGIARTISDAGYYIADAMGFFREDGLDVSITAFNSAAQMIAPLGTGELDVGGGTVSAGFYNAVGRGIGMKIVADQASIKPGYGSSSLMVRKDHVLSGRYKTFADLKGMKVAIGAPGTGTASAPNEALKKGGLKYGDVDVVYIGFPEHLPAYKQGHRIRNQHKKPRFNQLWKRYKIWVSV